MSGKKVYLETLGCAKNQVDAEVMLGTLARDGYEITLDPDEADVYIVNTCAFIQAAKEESIDTILRMGHLKEDRQGRKLLVTGCLAERYGQELRTELPEVDAFVGTGDFLRLEEVLQDAGLRTDGPPPAYVGAQHVLPDRTVPRILTGAFYSAYLKISEGCNHRCAFCIIPKIRGRHESRRLEDLVGEAQSLAGQGVRELNLIAQDLTAYGRDLPERHSLADLLRALADVDGVDWIRLLYCYPNYVTGELLDVIAEEPRVCRYVDMPLQHGSDRMLRAMRRERSADSLKRLIDRIRDRVPDVTLRTSFIVGFPGETEEDFEALCRFVEDIRFDRVGVFRYSREENTAAGTMPGQVPERVKEERWHRLMALQQEIAREGSLRRVGSILPVLACGTDEEGRTWGRTADQAPDIDGVVFLDGEFVEGEIAPVRITDASPYDLYGTRADPTGSIEVDRIASRP